LGRHLPEGWQCLISLRKTWTTEVGHVVINSIISDPSVLFGLGVAQNLSKIRETTTPPAALLLVLKNGPNAHLKANAYTYRRQIDTELVRVGRVRELQRSGAALTISALISVLIGISTFISQYAYDKLVVDSDYCNLGPKIGIHTALCRMTCG
jgi:hypothetical protein